VTRFLVLGGFFVVASVCVETDARCGAAGDTTLVAPYPASTIVTGVTFDTATLRRLGGGSDNWPVTWADDDHQYTSWGDGTGFGYGGTSGPDRVSLGFGRVEGPVTTYDGINVWGGTDCENPAQFEGKTFALLCVEGVLYAFVSPGSGAASFAEARLAYSLDHAATWTLVDWAFTIDDGFTFPAFLNFGRDYEGARDDYVYAYFIELEDPSDIVVQIPGAITLGRVPRDEILLRKSWEFFAGLDEFADPTWSQLVSERQPVFEDPLGVGWSVSVSFNPGIGRYLLCTEHIESGVGNLGMFDAAEPWGQWTTVTYVNGWEGLGNVFHWNFANKWLSEDGRDFALVYSGRRREDAWHTIRGSFEISAPPLGVDASSSMAGWNLAFRQDGQHIVFRIGVPEPYTGAPLRLDLFDVAGRHVAKVLRDRAAGPEREFRWTPRSHAGRMLPPGVYHARLVAAREHVHARGVLIR